MHPPTVTFPVPGQHRTRCVAAVLLVLVALLTLIAPALTAAQNDPGFQPLIANQRVYDETGTLTPDQTADLERRLAALVPIGADTVVYVRALDADPDATRDQVEDLKQIWAQSAGIDPDTAAAILINRNPDDANDARAGVWVGQTLDRGNIPEDEARAIVDDALIPPLRAGDIYGSLVAGLDRMSSSIEFGPPRSAFERWSSDATDSWFPWAAIGTALAGLAGSVSLFRGRQTTDRPAETPTTQRPGDLPPAVGGALIHGGPQMAAIPATLLDLAGRGALTIEPEGESGRFSKPKIQIRLVDNRLVENTVDSALWVELDRLARDGVVSSRNLAKLSGKTKTVYAAIREHLAAHRWPNPAASRARAGLFSIAAVAGGLAIFTGVVASNGDNWWLAGAGIAVLTLVALAATVLGSTYSGLTREGQEAAIPWKAYRDGLKRAGKDESIALDLDAILPDVVAMGLGSALDKRLKAAGSSGQTLRAFSGATGMNGSDGTTVAYFPFWVAFNSSVTSTSASSSSTVSSSGGGSGGGAAGST